MQLSGGDSVRSSVQLPARQHGSGQQPDVIPAGRRRRPARRSRRRRVRPEKRARPLAL